jgi:hypothetical protein
MELSVRDCAGIGVRLQYDGRVHALRNLSGTWDVRLELEQLGAGEIIGVGSVSTPMDAPHDGITGRVIVGGQLGPDGTGVLALTPLAAGGRAAVTMTVRFAPRLEGQEPVIAEVLAIEGLPV